MGQDGLNRGGRSKPGTTSRKAPVIKVKREEFQVDGSKPSRIISPLGRGNWGSTLRELSDLDLVNLGLAESSREVPKPYVDFHRKQVEIGRIDEAHSGHAVDDDSAGQAALQTSWDGEGARLDVATARRPDLKDHLFQICGAGVSGNEDRERNADGNRGRTIQPFQQRRFVALFKRNPFLGRLGFGCRSLASCQRQQAGD